MVLVDEVGWVRTPTSSALSIFRPSFSWRSSDASSPLLPLTPCCIGQTWEQAWRCTRLSPPMARPLGCLVAMTSILTSKKTRIGSFWGSFCATWALLIAAGYIKLTGSVANCNPKGICGPCNPVGDSCSCWDGSNHCTWKEAIDQTKCLAVPCRIFPKAPVFFG